MPERKAQARVANPMTTNGAAPIFPAGLSPRLAGTVLAFDFGEKRMGVAVGELSLAIAHPLETIIAASDDARLEHVQRLIRAWSPVLLVVGLPTHMDGTEHELSKRCRAFALQLEHRFSIECRLVDERLTSHAAGQSLAEAGVRGRRQKGMLDQVAAQHILETFFTASHGAA
jgi:putative Holliday junction resolvase